MQIGKSNHRSSGYEPEMVTRPLICNLKLDAIEDSNLIFCESASAFRVSARRHIERSDHLSRRQIKLSSNLKLAPREGYAPSWFRLTAGCITSLPSGILLLQR